MQIANRRMTPTERVAVATEWLDHGCQRYEDGNKDAVVQKWQSIPSDEFQDQIRKSAAFVNVSDAEMRRAISEYFGVRFLKGRIVKCEAKSICSN